MARAIVCDTSFWIAAFDENDGAHRRAAAQLSAIRNRRIIMPWPITYEVLRSRTVQNVRMVRAFDRVLAGNNVVRVRDEEYRDGCLNATIRSALAGRAISLVDMVVRAVLSDKKYRITELLTFDRADFADVCRERNIRVLPDL